MDSEFKQHLAERITVRPAKKEDVAALDLFLEPFVEDKRLLGRTLDELEELVSTGYIAEFDGMFVGFATLEIYSMKLAEIRSLAVSPIYQGVGIGKKLVDACVELAKQKDILEVMAITASEEFFRACGFDYILPGQKKALFLQTRDDDHK